MGRLLPLAVNRTALVLGACLVGAAPSGISAQVPGYQQINPASIRAEYNAEVLDRINDLLADWGEAWATDRVDDLVDLYWEDAVLIPPDGAPHRGRDRIREYLVEALPAQGHIEAFMLDFDASGGMAQVFGNYMLGILQGPAAETKTGPMLTVYAQRGRRWRIRSQVFMPS